MAQLFRWRVLTLAGSLALAAGLAACGEPVAQPAAPAASANLPATPAPSWTSAPSASQPIGAAPSWTSTPRPAQPTAVAAVIPTGTTPAPVLTCIIPLSGGGPTVYLPLITAGVCPSPTPTVMPTATPTPTGSAVTTVHFSIGAGSSDVIPHQIVRTADDRVYILVNQQYTSYIYAYWTATAGLPSAASAFNGSARLTVPAEPLSVEAAYDGGHIVHVLTNLNSGTLYDYPFDTALNSFQPGISLATDAATVTGDYIGSSGVSGMVDTAGILQVAYWSSGNHIVHKAYTYTGGVLSQVGSTRQVDLSGSANHPALAVSPVTNALTVAWVSQATTPARILVRSRSSAGLWDTAATTVSTAPVWTSTSSGINIDQGPSLLIGPDGAAHLTYIENWDATGSYGHIHVVSNPGSGWTDMALPFYSHDPALALKSSGTMYIIGHGHPKSQTTDSNCKTTDNMCTIKQNSNGTWGMQQLFAAAVPPSSYDSSASVKWSVVGLNRPDAVEFLFFSVVSGDYGHPTIWYGRF
jgi:hypothetical protein